MKHFFYIVLCMLLLSCQDVKKPEKPDNLIPEDVMVALLSEIYLGNAARSVDNKSMQKKGVKIDSFLFKKYSVDSLQFAKSNAYYASDLDAYNAIFQKIEEKLEVLKTEENDRKLKLNAEIRAKRKAGDSLSVDELEEVEEAIDSAGTEGRIMVDSATSLEQ